MKCLGVLATVWFFFCCHSWTPATVSAKRIPAWHIRIARQQGPNACVVEEVPGANWKIWTECKYWPNRKICGQKTIIRYECCEGFNRIPGQEGCSGVKPLKNILETARDIGATDFVKYVEESGLQKDWSREGAFTLFAPTNEAFARIPRDLRRRLETFRGDIENPILRYHISDGKLTSENFHADLMLPTLLDSNRLRINKYSSGMSTVNCLVITRKDQEATNGVVHLIDGVLDPSVAMNRDVSEIISTDGRFSVLAKAMEESAFYNKLRSIGTAAITILAPNDEAFQKIPASRLEAIFNDKEARLALLMNHVLVNPLCTPAIIDEHSMRTFGGKKLSLECDAKGTMVEKTRVGSDFVLGNNGIVHMIDQVILPNRAKNLLELAQSEQLNTFLELVKIGGVEEAFAKFGDYTIFIPSEAAFHSLPAEKLQDMRSSQEKAQMAILYHATQGRILTKKSGITRYWRLVSFDDGRGRCSLMAVAFCQLFMSLDEENPIRLSVYRKAIGVESGIVEKADMEGQNGVIHIINRVIFPANISAGDLLNQEGNFTTFLRAMESLTLTGDDGLDLSTLGGSATFFVPTDAAFVAMGASSVEAALENPVMLKQIVANHIVPGLYNSGSFRPDLIYNLNAVFGSLAVQRSLETGLKVNGAAVLRTDLMSANGIIHVIDKVLMPVDDDVGAEPLVE